MSPFKHFVCGKWMCEYENANGGSRAVFSNEACSDFVYSSKPRMLQSGFGIECGQCCGW